MTKSELKTGMIITLRNGMELVFFQNFVVNNNLFRISPNESIAVDGANRNWVKMDAYNDDLTSIRRCDKHLDIMKVEIPYHPYVVADISYEKNSRTTLWERTPPKKLTVSEIEAILGYKVEIVSEEKEN